MFIDQIKSNYPPVGWINAFFKPLKKSIDRRVLSFLNINILNYAFTALNNDESVLLVMLDIFKACDCIDYDILLKKLENAGIRRKM